MNVNRIVYSWGGGDGDRLSVQGEEDSSGVGVCVLVGLAGELCESDEGGVAGVGVGGGDKGDECLGNEEVSLSMLPSGSKDKTGAII